MKTVLITGASRGIGKAVAQKFLQEGYFVIGTSRAGTVDFEHENLIIFSLDLLNSESIAACAQAIGGRNKKIDILINNAGMWFEGDYDKEVDTNILRKTLEGNLIGVVDFTERLIPFLNKGAHVINISSRQGSFGYIKTVYTAAYSISKAALNMYTRHLAYRLAGEVIVSAVHPGYVKTDMNEGEGEIESDEAAVDIFNLSVRDVPSGQFWHKGENFPW